ncbi:MAG: hypothetical protein ACLVGD_04270 [Monoglobales bacterium]|nr:MAG TPA: hypothetical protein [Bacteriophage sp.]DAR72105.1 MAG TPA: hypothetical protein [Caudoviricetes sp.]
MNMKSAYQRSLQMIKELNIKNKKEYRKLVRNYLILNFESLKYMSQTKSFRKIKKMAKST